MPESIQKKKGRVRPPRVHIEYEVELGGAIRMKELPFVVGVLSDLTGASKKEQPKLKDRTFTTVDRDNFDTYLKSLAPRVAMKVDNKLTGEGELSVELEFEKLADFGPDAIVQKVEPMAKLAAVRRQLRDLLSRTDGNDRLEELLAAVMENSELRDKLKSALEAGGNGAAAPESAD